MNLWRSFQCLVNFAHFLLYSDRSLRPVRSNWPAYFWTCRKIEHEMLSVSENGCTWFGEGTFLVIDWEIKVHSFVSKMMLFLWSNRIPLYLRYCVCFFICSSSTRCSNVSMCIPFSTNHEMAQKIHFHSIQTNQL